MKIGYEFKLVTEQIARVSEVFAIGFNFHTFDANGNCISGQQYCLKTELEKIKSK